MEIRLFTSEAKGVYPSSPTTEGENEGKPFLLLVQNSQNYIYDYSFSWEMDKTEKQIFRASFQGLFSNVQSCFFPA